MRFLQQLLLLLYANISYGFTPSYPKSSKISAPHRQLQYVRHEDEIEWIDTNFHQPPPPPQQRQESLCLYMFCNMNSSVQYDASSLSLHLTLVCLYLIAFATHMLLTEVTVISLLFINCETRIFQQLQPLQTQDYEDMVNARFSRHDRRARLRTSITYGEWEIRRRLEEQEQREREHENLMDQESEELIYHEQQLDHHEYQQLENIQPSTQQSYNHQHTTTNTDYPMSSISKHPIPFPDAEYIPSTILYNNVKCLIPCNDYMAREIMSSTNHHQHSRSLEHHEEQLQYVTLNNVDYLIHTLDEVIIPQDSDHHDQQDNHGRAYWLQSKLHNAIYGQVRYGTMLTKLDSPIQVMVTSPSHHHHQQHEENEEYWITINYKTSSEQSVAIKEMNWEHIKSQRDVLAEDPIKEVSALQYLERWWKNHSQTEKNNRRRRDGSRVDGGRRRLLHEQQHSSSTTTLHNIEIESEVSHICMPLDLLSDDVNLYSITPYCTGGRLLDQIENKSRFSEPEARYWMRQILTGLTCLKRAGVAHRDLSPENLMVHDGNVYIIDLGMCLRIPSLHGNHDDNGHDIINSSSYHPDERALIAPQTPCGKWYYLSPEVCLSEEPFDGPAVDLWAAGVILFIMLTGIPPWEEPKMSDENFKLMSTGYLVQILTDRRVGLSIDAMDLLQRMFWLNPADRLSLEQVCEHPWLTHNEYNMESRGDASNDID